MMPMALLLALLTQDPDVGENSSDEPIAKQFSLERGRKFMDNASLQWQSERNCLTCHTNFSYLVTGAAHVADREAYANVRKYTEDLVGVRWVSKGPRWDTEVVVAAMGLAFSDAGQKKPLHPLTKKALDRMWKVQRPDGAWNWIDCGWPPMESDEYWGVTAALLAAGRAPGGYASTPQAAEGIRKAKEFLTKNAPPSLHHQGMLFWASTFIDGLMTPEEQKKTVNDLLALQRPDGGWAIATFLEWKRTDGTPQEKDASDGYGTGYVIHLARVAGIPASDPRLVKGIEWIKTHQRESGRWFTRSLKKDSRHYLTHAGTAFALLALDECETK